jgi:hypothetical protein
MRDFLRPPLHQGDESGQSLVITVQHLIDQIQRHGLLYRISHFRLLFITLDQLLSRRDDIPKRELVYAEEP